MKYLQHILKQHFFVTSYNVQNIECLENENQIWVRLCEAIEERSIMNNNNRRTISTVLKQRRN